MIYKKLKTLLNFDPIEIQRETMLYQFYPRPRDINEKINKGLRQKRTLTFWLQEKKKKINDNFLVMSVLKAFFFHKNLY